MTVVVAWIVQDRLATSSSLPLGPTVRAFASSLWQGYSITRSNSSFARCRHENGDSLHTASRRFGPPRASRPYALLTLMLSRVVCRSHVPRAARSLPEVPRAAPEELFGTPTPWSAAPRVPLVLVFEDIHWQSGRSSITYCRMVTWTVDAARLARPNPQAAPAWASG